MVQVFLYSFPASSNSWVFFFSLSLSVSHILYNHYHLRQMERNGKLAPCRHGDHLRSFQSDITMIQAFFCCCCLLLSCLCQPNWLCVLNMLLLLLPFVSWMCWLPLGLKSVPVLLTSSLLSVFWYRPCVCVCVTVQPFL